MKLILIALAGLFSITPATVSTTPDQAPLTIHALSTAIATEALPEVLNTAEVQIHHQIRAFTGSASMLLFDWEKLPQGCHYTGNSACGGSDRFKCSPKQRYFTWECVVFGQVYRNAGCKTDTAC